MSTQFQTWRPKPRRSIPLYSHIDITGLRGVFLVIFVLLCMFPGPNSTAHNHFQADLPEITSAYPHPNALRDDAVQIGILRRGDIFLFGNRHHSSIEKVAAVDLPIKLHAMLLPGVERRVYVHADAGAKYADIETALDAIRYAGLSNVTFIVERRCDASH